MADKQNRFTQYLGVATMEIIEHLLTWYGKITPNDSKETKEKTYTLINTYQTIRV